MTAAPAPRKVPITELGKEYQVIKAELTPLLDQILQSGAYTLGRHLDSFEKELADYVGAKFAIGLNSGTDALWLALKALNVGIGDEVLVPAMSFFASVEPIVHLGAKPVFVDIDPQTYAIETGTALKAITPRTKAIIAVHLYGLPADLKELSTLSKDKRIALIEDMAQAIGSTFDGKKIGSWGDMACLSFYPTKNLGACGDAGAILTSQTELADRLKTLRNHGAKIKYHHDEAGFNSRLDEIQAVILRLKLKHLEGWNEKRRGFAKLYTQLLQGLPITLPSEPTGRRHVYHLYTIQTDQRDALKSHLEARGISVGLHYPIALHLLPAMKSFHYKSGDFPNAEKLARCTLSLPLYPFMTTEDVQYVADQVRAFYQARV